MIGASRRARMSRTWVKVGTVNAGLPVVDVDEDARTHKAEKMRRVRKIMKNCIICRSNGWLFSGTEKCRLVGGLREWWWWWVMKWVPPRALAIEYDVLYMLLWS